MKRAAILTYIINLKSRIDRREHILKEFVERDEFNIHIVVAIEHEIGAIGLWNTIKHILEDLTHQNDNYIILCEDDHVFTPYYNLEKLVEVIAEAIEKEADILCGGISWLTSCLQFSQNMFWVERFSGLQFTIIFRKFYQRILEASFNVTDAADYKISSLTNNKYFIFPFFSTQKDFGYSDVTAKNNVERSVENLFKDTSENIKILKDVFSFYSNRRKALPSQTPDGSFENITIPTYIINHAEHTDRKKNIKKQFEKRDEFDLTFVDAVKHAKENVGLWLNIRKIIQLALENEDDVIVICQDCHEFTKDYSRDIFLNSVIEAHQLDAELLCGSVGSFGMSVPVTQNKWWLNSFSCAQFIVLYKSIFQRSLNEPYDDSVIADVVYSKIANNKMTFFPFISIQNHLASAHISASYNRVVYPITNLFEPAEKRFTNIQQAMQRNSYH